jgi:1-aminocyclopropane-1-carboxylate deaminase/D-cysteine desulfhydrase-like pyridoxal-dependent ACC family enzyme
VPADRAVLERLHALPRLPLAFDPPPIEELARLRESLGSTLREPQGRPEPSRGTTGSGSLPRLLVKRDDAIPLGFGGNKVRKLQVVGAQAIAAGADTLITTGGVQSNHARATAAVAARMGLGCVLVANGSPQEKPTANALLDRLLGAEVRYVASRDARVPAMEQAAGELRAQGRKPFVIPLGASTPHGAAAYAAAVGEILTQIPPPDLIVVATSSGGTQAGILAGCILRNLQTRVVGISADDPAGTIAAEIRRILGGLEELIGMASGDLTGAAIEIDDTFVGGGYGVPTPASTEAIELCARREALFLDPTYTAKAMAGLIARIRKRELHGTVLFWHTGGQVGLFA